MSTSLTLALALALLVGVLLGAGAALTWSRRHDVLRARTLEGGARVQEGLDRLHDRMGDLEQHRASWQSRLHQQVEDVRLSTDSLRRETGALATALRRPAVRGRWGELHLRRTVELAGLVEHCDFEEQVHLTGDDGVRRPDLVVRLAGGRSIVVDAKVPLEAYLDALEVAEDPDTQADHLRRHARQLRAHVEALSAKSYWKSLPSTPEFVVLFVPAESCLAAALEADHTLIEHAAARSVVLASPTTLIALLRTVAHGWTTAALAERTREIHELGRDLHVRLGVMGGHLDRVGRSLKASVESYNRCIGSLENRVLVTARQFEDIGMAHEPLASPAPVTQAPRPLGAAELLETLTPARDELPEPGPHPRQHPRHRPGPDLGSGSARRVADG